MLEIKDDNYQQILQKLYHQWYQNFYYWLNGSILATHEKIIKEIITYSLFKNSHGDMIKWLQVFLNLPNIMVKDVNFNNCAVSISAKNNLSGEQQKQLNKCLKNLCPWRVGPFNFFNEYIDSEWCSNLKWDRIFSHLNINNKLVLDVGCNSGYFCWKLLGAGARRVIGVEPAKLCMFQFQAFKFYAGYHLPIDILPIKIEDLPQNSRAFDVILSMGVLYHRKSPLLHLESLFYHLRPGGELIIETLIIEGNENNILIPEKRYAMMNNVWFIPSIQCLLNCLKKIKFINLKVIDINQTQVTEQRSTSWMTNHSLKQFLCPTDYNFTIEGYPAPLRAIIIATRPK